jgi:glycolate oxidase FAD binding subunit
MIERLRRIAGDDAVRDGARTSFRVHGRQPEVVVSPASAEQAADVLRACSENHWTVEPAGAGTWLDWGRPPQHLDVLLTAERLAGVTDYVPADLTISVAAGTPLAEVAETVSFDRQMLGFDPPARPGATIGATIATASAGPLRLSVGTPRDQVLGLELVTGDGRIARLGGRVVKNVAGYDLVRLIVGSRGTLGFITQAHIRLRPAPEHELTAVFTADQVSPLLELALGPITRTWPAAVELFGPATASALGLVRMWTLAVRCRGNHAFVDAARSRLATLGGANQPVFLDDVEGPRIWESLTALEAQASTAVRLTSLPSRLPRLIELVGAANSSDRKSDNESGWMLAAHAASGILRVWRAESPAGADLEALGKRFGEIRQEVVNDGGTVTLPVVPDGLADRLDAFDVSGPALELARGLKTTFDPAGILSPARFIV